MLKSIKERIKSSFANLPSVKEAKNRQINQVNLQLILSQLHLKQFIPYTTWTMSPTALLHILNYIKLNNPKYIVEFGSGISTILIGKLIAQENLDTKLISIDNDADWTLYINENLKKEAILESVANCYFVPLKVSFTFENKQIFWYDEKILKDILGDANVDFLIVDGPPGSYLNSRAGALIYFQDAIAKDKLTYIFDDTNRVEEFNIVEQLGKKNIHLNDYTLGGKKRKFDSLPLGLMK